MSFKDLLDRFQMACVSYGKWPDEDAYLEMKKYYDLLMLDKVKK